MLVYFYLLANLNLEIFILFIALISKWIKLISFHVTSGELVRMRLQTILHVTQYCIVIFLYVFINIEIFGSNFLWQQRLS